MCSSFRAVVVMLMMSDAANARATTPFEAPDAVVFHRSRCSDTFIATRNQLFDSERPEGFTRPPEALSCEMASWVAFCQLEGAGGFTRDAEGAKAYATSAANRGCQQGRLIAGTVYVFTKAGPDDTRNDVKARQFLEAYIRHGGNDYLARHGLGYCYLDGWGGPRNPEAAAELWYGEARAGWPIAQILLASQFAKGNGLPKDIVQAYAWLETARRIMERHPELRVVPQFEQVRLIWERTISPQLTQAQRTEALRLAQNFQPKPTRKVHLRADIASIRETAGLHASGGAREIALRPPDDSPPKRLPEVDPHYGRDAAYWAELIATMWGW